MGIVELSFSENKLLKDPTEPQVGLESGKSTVDQVKDLHLTAIFISGIERHAVINDQVVKKGDLIGNKVVQEIDTYTVKLMDGGKEKTLYLLGSEISIKGQPK